MKNVNAKLFYLLEELKDNYSEQILSEIIECFSEEVVIDDLFKDNEKAKKYLNNLPTEFYNKMSESFVNDLDNVFILYFIIWEPLISFFNENERDYFLKYSSEISSNSDTKDFLNGKIELLDGKPEIALFHFNRIEDYFVDYFTSICYQELENYENAIIKNLSFINQFNTKLQETSEDEIDFSKLNFIRIVKWDVYIELVYLYNQIKDFKNAIIWLDKSIKLIDFKATFLIKNNEEDEINEFKLFTNNYLYPYEKLNNYAKCVEILEEVLTFLPKDENYKKQLKVYKEKLNNNTVFNEIISQVFRVKKPFNISTFKRTKLIAKEKNLEDMIVEQIKYGFKVFNKNLEIYKDEKIFGRQYYIKNVNGILDLLLIEKETKTLYLVELKRNEAGIEVVEQLENYIKGLSKEMDRKIKGIICLHKPNNELVELVKAKKNIELFTYEFNFTRIE